MPGDRWPGICFSPYTMTIQSPTTIPDRIASQWPPEVWRQVNVVLAISGGADSVALLLAVDQLRKSCRGDGQLIVAHVNHHFRNTESDRDARWVGQLASRLGLRFELRDASPPEGPHSGRGLEGRMRQQRYDWLAQVAREAGARWLVTAHHANDQAETVLFRMLRGTGVDGLAGIPRTRVIGGGITLCRPMLDITRPQIEAWLNDQNQSWCVDQTNLDTSFSRNRIRHEIMPQLQHVVSVDVVQSLCELARSASEVRQLLDRLAGPVLDNHFEFAPNGFTINVGDEAIDPCIWGHAIRLAWKRAGWPRQEMSRDRWNRLLDVLIGCGRGRETAAFDMPGQVHVQATAGQMQLARSPRTS